VRAQLALFTLFPVAFTTSTAVAEPWLTAEVPAAFAVSDAQAESFRGGAMPAVGLYGRAASAVALGVRGRAGVLGDASSAMTSARGLVDPRWGGLATLSMAVRVGGTRPWIEGAAGGALTGTDVVPAVELGAGWLSSVGSLELGPSVRYLHVRDAGGPGLGSAGIVLVGLELRRARSSAPRRPARDAGPAPDVRIERDADRLVDVSASCADDPDACATAARDGDTLIDVSETCAVLSEALGDDGGGGCSEAGPLQVRADRIILAERVLFASDRARVRRAARPVLRAIADAWRRGEWHRVIVEGHADVRGDADYNQRLSALRAERAKAVLVDAGIPSDAIETVGHGATRPRSADDHERNRRVEFVVLPRPAAAGVAP